MVLPEVFQSLLQDQTPDALKEPQLILQELLVQVVLTQPSLQLFAQWPLVDFGAQLSPISEQPLAQTPLLLPHTQQPFQLTVWEVSPPVLPPTSLANGAQIHHSI